MTDETSQARLVSSLYDLIRSIPLIPAAPEYANEAPSKLLPQPITRHHMNPTGHSFWGITVPFPLLINELSSASLLAVLSRLTSKYQWRGHAMPALVRQGQEADPQ